MYGTPISAAILATDSAIFSACASDSMTHGPAMRKNGFPSPRVNWPSLIELEDNVPITKFRHATREEKFVPSLRAIDSLHVQIHRTARQAQRCYPNPSA